MADAKLSELSEALFLDALDEFYLVKDGNSRKIKNYHLRLSKYRWAAQSTDSTTVSQFGLTTTSWTTGTAGSVPLLASPTVPHEFYHKIGYITTAAININAGLIINRASGQKRGHDSLANIGGFHWWARFTPLVSSAAAARCLFGMYNSTSFPTATVEPSAQTAQIFAVAKDSTDTNIQFLGKGPAGDISKTDIGITLASLQNVLLDLHVLALRNGAVYLYLRNMDTGTSYSHTFADGSIYIPARATTVYFHLVINTGSQAVQQRIGLIGAEGITLD